MRVLSKIMVFLSVFMLVGCASLPSFKFPSIFGKREQLDVASLTAKIAAEEAAKVADKLAEADKKVEEARKKMELEYAKQKEELQKIYDERAQKVKENMTKIGELNYGIFYVSEEKRKADINTTISYLRSKEIMNRMDTLTENSIDRVKKEVDEEKRKSFDELFAKYKASTDLAIHQKQALDAAQALIEQREKEMAALREANKVTIENLEREKREEYEKQKRETASKVEAAKQLQKVEMLGYIIKALVATGIIFLILAVLLKSPIFGGVSLLSLGLAYIAATVPFWVIASAMGLIIIGVIFIDPKTGSLVLYKKLSQIQKIL
jgi:hypothetical protein